MSKELSQKEFLAHVFATKKVNDTLKLPERKQLMAARQILYEGANFKSQVTTGAAFFTFETEWFQTGRTVVQNKYATAEAALKEINRIKKKNKKTWGEYLSSTADSLMGRVTNREGKAKKKAKEANRKQMVKDLIGLLKRTEFKTIFSKMESESNDFQEHFGKGKTFESYRYLFIPSSLLRLKNKQGKKITRKYTMTLPHRQALAEMRWQLLVRLKKIDKQGMIRLSKNEWKLQKDRVRDTLSQKTKKEKNVYLNSDAGQDFLMDKLEFLWDLSWQNIVAFMTEPKKMPTKKGKKVQNGRFWAETSKTIMAEILHNQELLDVKLKF